MKSFYKNTNRPIILILSIIISLLLVACGASDSPKVYRVGVLSGVDVFNVAVDGFKAKMLELGYVEGENISYDVQMAGGDAEKMQEIAQKFVDDNVDLIFVTTSRASQITRSATENADIPVVFTMVMDPVGGGIVPNLANPSGNVTGIGNPIAFILDKRLEFLRQMAPDTKSIWIPYNPNYPTVNVSLPAIREAASAMGLNLIETKVTSPDAFLAELEMIAKADTLDFDAIHVMPDPVIQHPKSWQALLAFANEHNLPIAANAIGQTKEGALFSYADDNFETGQFAAHLVDEILKGSKPATIPIIFAEPHLVINYKVAQTLGLTIDEGLLNQAAEIIR